MQQDNPANSGQQPDIAHQLLKFLLEIGPLIIFFLSNSWQGIQFATKVFMVATLVSLILSRWLLGKIALMPLVTAVFVMFFGGLTVWLDNDLFIKIKPTIVNFFFAGALFTGLFFGKSLLKYVFEDAFRMSNEGWVVLTRRWGLFFIFLAAMNEIVWRNFTTDTWVAFKTFAIMPLTMVFAISQLGVIKQHELTDSDSSRKDHCSE
ncbi:MAG: septation protein A [Hyphomicrobiaceae bacterium]